MPDIFGDEKSLMKIIFVFSVFTLVVVSSGIGVALMAYGLFYIIMLYNDRRGVFEFSRGGSYNWVKTFTVGIILAFVFLLAGSLVYSTISSTPPSLFSSLGFFASQSSKIPITIDNPIIKELIWGIMIPILESLFFIGFIGKQLVNFYKLDGIKFRNMRGQALVKVVVVCLVVGSAAALFHLAADVTTQSALAMDIAFFGFSMGMAIGLNQLKEIAILHGVINSLSVLKPILGLG